MSEKEKTEILRYMYCRQRLASGMDPLSGREQDQLRRTGYLISIKYQKAEWTDKADAIWKEYYPKMFGDA